MDDTDAQGQATAFDAPQAVAIDLRRVSARAGVAEMVVPYRVDLVGEPATGVIAGGVITTLLDHVCGMAVGLAVAGERSMATLDLRIDYMRAAIPGRDVTARAHCYKLTRSIAFVRAAAFEDDEADPVATAQGAFALAGPPAGP